MANHKSSIKRIRANETKRLRNRYQHKSARTILRELRSSTTAKEAEELLNKAFSSLDKLAKRNIIHKNKASNLKGKLQKFANGLS